MASKTKCACVTHATSLLQRSSSCSIDQKSDRHALCSRTGSVRSSAAPTAAASAAKPKGKSQEEIDEEDALQLAISLSQSEADEKERQKKRLTQQYATSNIQFPSTPLGSAPVADQVRRSFRHCESRYIYLRTHTHIRICQG